MLSKIAEIIKEETGKRYPPRFIGGIVRENLNLKTRHTRNGTVVIGKDSELKKLAEEYNIASLIEYWESYSISEKTFQTQLSQSIDLNDNGYHSGKKR